MTYTENETEDGNDLSLTADILETIGSMFLRPKMYAGSADSFETQFFTLVVLVAPYAFGMDSQSAGRLISDYVAGITGSVNLGLASKYDDIDTVAKLLETFYKTNFDVILEKTNSTIH